MASGSKYRRTVAVLLLVFAAGMVPAQNQLLSVEPDDVRIDQTIEGGYYLYVRRTEGMGSVLITESTEAPDHKAATYAFRNPEFCSQAGSLE